MKSTLYTNVVLTVIALLLAFHAFVKVPTATVHAQKPITYRTAVVWFVAFTEPQAGRPKGVFIPLDQRLNEVAKGQKLVGLVPYSEHGFLAVFQEE